MALNHIGSGQRITVKAAAARTSGVPMVEHNIHGIPETSPAENELYALMVEEEWVIPFITSSVQGDVVDINNSTKALTRRAYGGAPATGTRPFATIVAVPGAGETTDATQAPKTGFMWVKILPQFAGKQE